jgi:hypothetical protein
MMRDVFERRRKVLGPEHVDTLGSQYNLAVGLYREQRLGDAERLLHLDAPGASAVVNLVKGGRLASLVINGRELLVTEGMGRMSWGSFPMAPFAGRVRALAELGACASVAIDDAATAPTTVAALASTSRRDNSIRKPPPCGAYRLSACECKPTNRRCWNIAG